MEELHRQLAAHMLVIQQRCPQKNNDFSAESLCDPMDILPSPHRYMLAAAMAGEKEPSIDFVSTLLAADERQVNIELGKYLVTPLFIALLKGWDNTAHFLIDQPKINLKTVNSLGETLLYAACGVSRLRCPVSMADPDVDLVAHLLRTFRNRYGSGAERDFVLYRRMCHQHGVVKAGESVLRLLISAKEEEMCRYLEDRDVVRLLVENGADLTPEAEPCANCALTGYSCLAYAITKEKDWFLEAALGVQLFDMPCNFKGTPALLYAVRSKASAATVRVLCGSRITCIASADEMITNYSKEILQAARENYPEEILHAVEGSIWDLITRIAAAKSLLAKKEEEYQANKRELGETKAELARIKTLPNDAVHFMAIIKELQDMAITKELQDEISPQKKDLKIAEEDARLACAKADKLLEEHSHFISMLEEEHDKALERQDSLASSLRRVLDFFYIKWNMYSVWVAKT